MRRSVFLIAAVASAVAGCGDSSPVDPSAIPSGSSTEVRNDTTPSPAVPPAAAEGGILIGSGT